MTTEIIAGIRPLPPRNFQTWRERSPVWAGRADGPCCIYSRDGRHELLLEASKTLAVFDSFEAAEQAMRKLVADWRAARDPKIYFIGEALKVGRFIKIGVSNRPERRLRQLQAGSPVTLQILASGPGGYMAEALWHDRFARFRQHNEWFRLTEKMVAEISRLAGGGAGMMWLTKPLPRTERFRALRSTGSKNQPYNCQIDRAGLSNFRTLGRCLRRATHPHDPAVNPQSCASKSQEHYANIEQFADPVRSQIGGAA